MIESKDFKPSCDACKKKDKANPRLAGFHPLSKQYRCNNCYYLYYKSKV